MILERPGLWARRGAMALGATFLVLAASGCESCKKKADEAKETVKKEIVAKLRPIEEAPAPANMIGELVIKDPEGLAKRAVDGAGFSAEVGPSPYEKLVNSFSDENVKKGLRSVDPHGAIAAVAIAKFGPSEKPHGALAAKLKDPELATVALTTGAKGGEIKAWDSKVLDTQVYEPGADGKGEIAVYGSVVIVADDRATIEAAGKYVAWKASKGESLGHDMTLRVPMDKIGPELQKLGNAAYGLLGPGDIPVKLKSALDPMVAPLLQGVADMGPIAIDLDVDTKVVKVDEKVDAKGTFATWLGSLPSGDASALLTMPKADGVSMMRFGDALGPILYASLDEVLGRGSMPAPEKTDLLKQVETLGKSLGDAVVMANKGSGPTSEFLLRFDLKDGPAAKGAMAALEKAGIKAAKLPTPPKVTPYKKYGAEGDQIDLPISAGSTVSLLWAVRGSFLFLGFANGGFSILDAGLDPASKATFDTDAAAKTRVASYPTKSIISASYGDTWSFSKSLLPGASPTPTPAPGGGIPIWSYATADSSGMVAKGEIP
ncbi:MAG: hypothetical protein ABI175_22310, partial [Polyangiales bacterium]